MTIATGIGKRLAYKKETAWGVMAPATGPNGQSLRRVTSNLDLKKATYQSKELRPDYQVANFRHGTRSVDGTISGELSVGTYKDFIATACRAAFVAPVTTGAAQIIFGATQTSGSVGTITRSAGSFIADGFKVGNVARFTGFVTASLNNTNFWITALTATVMTGQFLNGTAMAVRAAGDSVVISQAGKTVQMASAIGSQVNDSYSIEHFFSDIGQSEVFTGCRVASVDVKLPATGFAAADIMFMGKDMVPNAGGAGLAYFTSPINVTAGAALAAVNGALFLGGLSVGLVTGLNIKLNAGMTSGDVVGSTTRPDIFAGVMDVSGQMTVYFQDAAIRDLFNLETEAALSCVFTTDNTGAADFMGFTMSRVKCGGATKDDGEKGLTMTVPFTALIDLNGGPASANNNTTLTVQDSLA